MMLWHRGDLFHGLWFTTRHILVAVADGAGCIHAESTIPRRDDARHAFVRTAAALPGAEIIVCANHFDPLVTMAGEYLPIWVVSSGFVDGLKHAAGIPSTRPRLLAALLARLPTMGYPWPLTMMSRRLPPSHRLHF